MFFSISTINHICLFRIAPTRLSSEKRRVILTPKFAILLQDTRSHFRSSENSRSKFESDFDLLFQIWIPKSFVPLVGLAYLCLRILFVLRYSQFFHCTQYDSCESLFHHKVQNKIQGVEHPLVLEQFSFSMFIWYNELHLRKMLPVLYSLVFCYGE